MDHPLLDLKEVTCPPYITDNQYITLELVVENKLHITGPLVLDCTHYGSLVLLIEFVLHINEE